MYHCKHGTHLSNVRQNSRYAGKNNIIGGTMQKHSPEVALSDARELFKLIKHYSGDPKVKCMEQYMCNILAYLETESIVRASEELNRDELEPPDVDCESTKCRPMGQQNCSQGSMTPGHDSALQSHDVICPFCGGEWPTCNCSTC